ncbi:MAG: Rne/Rng family ribonuclease, partial [Pseudomonadota bacterium]
MKSNAAFEATLFYAAPLGTEFSDLTKWIKSAFARSQITARVKYTSDYDLAFAIGDLTLTVALSPTPLDLRDLQNTSSPNNAFGLSQSTQRILTRHTAAVAIGVTGSSPAAQQKTRLAVCYIATLQMMELSAPDLIHWTASNTVYTLPEFCRRTGENERRLRRLSRPVAKPANCTMPPFGGWMNEAEREDMQIALKELRASADRAHALDQTPAPTRRIAAQPEERGNKGAALTTYLSLAGRYCVLMPNTARGGGISRKITNASDRKKLKEIAGEIDVPIGAGLIIRTAGAKRTKSEIKRDYEYLQRLWEQIRDLTLNSIAPAKIYEEGDLIKRSIRDLYSREIDEVHVEGDGGYRTAKDFMKMIMPSHAKNVKQYTDPMPLFARYQVESYLSSMFNPTVQLRSGGYIVIGVTEALVAIDVNSGRATKEGSIEETALKTNLEAAEEVARQLRLRDLAGLIVIDFIDMEERKNNSAVEKRFKEKLKTDRARIQVGRISGFGLMEMSRQRLRPGMIEATTQPCPHCHGTGLIRSDDSLALSILRQLEEEGTRRKNREVLLKAPVGIVNYLMNQKREHVSQIEARYGMSVRIEADPFMIPPDFTIEKFKTATRVVTQSAPVVSVDASMMPAEEEEPEVVETAEAEENGDQPKKRRRRRRRRRGGGSEGAEGADAAETATDEAEASAEAAPEAEAETADEKPKRRRRRSRSKTSEDETGEVTADASAEAPAEDAQRADEAPLEEEKPKRRRSRSRKKAEDAAEATPEASGEEAADVVDPEPTADVQPEAEVASQPEPEP